MVRFRTMSNSRIKRIATTHREAIIEIARKTSRDVKSELFIYGKDSLNCVFNAPSGIFSIKGMKDDKQKKNLQY